MRARKPELRLVLLDASFLNALLAVDDPSHGAAVALYRTLVDRYQDGLDRLFALSTVLGDLPREFRRNALGPVVTLRVSGQHHSAARATIGATSEATALSLVMMRREHIRTVATASHDFDDIDVEVLSVDEWEAAFSDMPPGYVEYAIDGPAGEPFTTETAPKIVRQSTAE